MQQKCINFRHKVTQNRLPELLDVSFPASHQMEMQSSVQHFFHTASKRHNFRLVVRKSDRTQSVLQQQR